MPGQVGEAETDLLDDDDGKNGKILLLAIAPPAHISREDAVNPNPNPGFPPLRQDWSLDGCGGSGGCSRPRRAVEREERGRGGGDRGQQGRRLNAAVVVRNDNNERARRKKSAAAVVIFGDTDVFVIVVFVVNVLVVLAIFAMVHRRGREGRS